MNILSLFDGMSCGQLALKRSGIHYNNYFASEIDRHAIKVTQVNFPYTIQLGDVRGTSAHNLPKIDLMFGGSPCQGFSFTGKQLNFQDPRSKLFFEFVRIYREVKVINPGIKFLLENVKMQKYCIDIISKELGVNPIPINSNLVSAQNRPRLYWTNIENVSMPQDRGILLKDILLTNYEFDLYLKNGKKKPSNNKAGCLTGTAHACGNHSRMDVIVKKGEQLNFSDTGRINIHINPFVRRYTPVECERLQTIPDNYTSCVSDSQRYKMVINGWTIDVIAHIFSHLKNNFLSKAA